MSSDRAGVPFWDPRRPWRISALVILCLATFPLFWIGIIIASVGESGTKGAAVAAGVLSALAVIAALLDWMSRRRRYPSEDRGSLGSVEGLVCATALLAALGAVALFGAWASRLDQETARSSAAGAPEPSIVESFSEYCKLDGIHYAGETAQGARVCLTLTPDGGRLIGVGVISQASGCAGASMASNESALLDASGQVEISDFSATIRGAKASGVFSDSELCPGKRYAWSARRRP